MIKNIKPKTALERIISGQYKDADERNEYEQMLANTIREKEQAEQVLKIIVEKNVNMKLINDMTSARSYNTFVGGPSRQLTDKQFKVLKIYKNKLNALKSN